MKFKNWTPQDLKTWASLLPSSSLMDCHNKILISGEIHVDNSIPKDGSEPVLFGVEMEGNTHGAKETV